MFFDDAPFGVMCRDAFLRVEGRNIVITPPSHEHRQRFSLDFAYDPAALAPIWRKALNEWFGTDEDGLRKQALLAQFIGAALFGLSTRYQKALFLVASGGNGKSQLLDVISALFPPSVLTGIAPQKWAEPYSRDKLAKARLNLVHKIPSSAIAAGSDFKAIITGDLIDAREIYSSPYFFRPRAAHIFSANAFPSSTDPSDGFWRRILVLTMHKRFDGTNEEAHDLAKIIINQELAGVLAWVVEGLRSLLRQDSYTIPQSSRDAVQLSRDSADPLDHWLNQRTAKTSDKSDMTKSSTLFADWKKWSAQSIAPKSQTAFSLALKLRVGKAKHMKTGKFYPLKLNENFRSFVYTPTHH
jgi:putative DNA primase/helicase